MSGSIDLNKTVQLGDGEEKRLGDFTLDEISELLASRVSPPGKVSVGEMARPQPSPFTAAPPVTETPPQVGGPMEYAVLPPAETPENNVPPYETR